MRRERIRALVVDDEAIARRAVIRQLDADDEIELIGDCGDGASAISTIKEQHPDLVFLDVQMPEKNGFDVIEAVGAGAMPVTVFITAHDEYAIRAFDVHAVDYLLKPFRRERFRVALERAKERLGTRNGDHEKLAALLREMKSSDYPRRIAAQQKGKVVFIDVEAIDCIESEANYVRVFAGAEAHLVRETLTELERRLNPRDFLRIHRSTIVNVRRIREVHPWFGGSHLVVLDNGRRLPFSRRERAKLKSLLEGF
jgi:two-component system LytT family response regulator